MLAIMVANVNTLLEASNGNHFEAMKKLNKQYNRGIYTREEYECMTDILASKIMWKK